MRLKAKEYLTYAGREWQPGALFDAPELQAREMINLGQAERFNLEDPSQRTVRDAIENLLPPVPGVTISPESALAAAAGDTGTLSVTITSPGASGSWTASKDAAADWLTYAPVTPQSTDGTVTWTAAANLDTARTGNLYINGKTFTVQQDAPVTRGTRRP